MSQRYGAAVLLSADYQHGAVFLDSHYLGPNVVAGRVYKQPKEAIKIQKHECGANKEIFWFPELDLKKPTKNLCQP